MKKKKGGMPTVHIKSILHASRFTSRINNVGGYYLFTYRIIAICKD